ncbi:MAG TPA: nucleotidyltransferase domain-containing protein [Ktedonobacterales bacterium]
METPSNSSPQSVPLHNGKSVDRALIVTILREHGVRHASLFGSVVRGEQRIDSDIDLLIDMPPGASLMDVSRLGLALEDALGRSVDLITSFETLHPAIQERLRHEAEILL